MTGNESPSRAAIYVPTATDNHRSDALAAQEAACLTYCVERSYLVQDAHVYREVAPGLSIDDRPALSRLRGAVAVGTVDVVVATAPDRLSRESAHVAGLVGEAGRAGARFEFVDVGDLSALAAYDLFDRIAKRQGVTVRMTSEEGYSDGHPR